MNLTFFFEKKSTKNYLLDILDTSVYENVNLTFIKVTMVSTGDGPVGASKLTGEVGVKNNNERINNNYC